MFVMLHWFDYELIDEINHREYHQELYLEVWMMMEHDQKYT